jgi:hypothetical protein
MALLQSTTDTTIGQALYHKWTQPASSLKKLVDTLTLQTTGLDYSHWILSAPMNEAVEYVCATLSQLSFPAFEDVLPPTLW